MLDLFCAAEVAERGSVCQIFSAFYTLFHCLVLPNKRIVKTTDLLVVKKQPSAGQAPGFLYIKNIFIQKIYSRLPE